LSDFQLDITNRKCLYVTVAMHLYKEPRLKMSVTEGLGRRFVAH